MIQYFNSPEPLELERGGNIEKLTIAYHTYGSLVADGSNVVWVCHALTANSDVSDWWPHTVEPGRFLDHKEIFRRMRQYFRFALRHDRPSVGISIRRTVLRRLSTCNYTGHRQCPPATCIISRHKPYPRSCRQFRRRLSGFGMDCGRT